MKNFIKHLCVIIILLGISVSAWGLTTSDIEHSASTTLTDGAAYVIATAYDGKYLTSTVSNGWGVTSNDIADAAIFNVHGDKNGFYLTCISGTLVPTTGNFDYYDDGTTANLQLDNSGHIVNSSYSTYMLTTNNGTPGGCRWYTSAQQGYVYLYKITSRFEVTYDAGSGTCGTDSKEQSVPGEALTLPNASPSPGCFAEGWVFAGWKRFSASTETTVIPTLLAAGSSYTPGSTETLYAVYRKGNIYTIDFEGLASSYSDWSFTHITSRGTNANVNAHSGSYFGLTSNTQSYQTIVTKSTIASPKFIEFYISKTSTNTGESYWKVYTSTDGSTWTERKSQAAGSGITRGAWTQVTQDLSDYSDVYVKVEYGTSSAIRCIDDLTLSCATFNSNPSCASCTEEPSVEDATLEGIAEGTISVSCDEIENGAGCATSEYGFVWKTGASAPTSTSDGTKVKVGEGSGGDAGFSANLSIAFTTGTTYQIVAYATNAAGTTLGEAVAVTPRSVTFNSNGGSLVATQYVNSGGTVSAPSNPTKTGFVFGGWYQESGLVNEVDWSATITADKIYYAKWLTYTDYKFSCAELTLTPKLVTENTPIFITATAGQTVRSLDSILVVGSGLTPNTDLAFPGLPPTFAVKSNQNATLRTDASGDINAVACIYYTPDGSSTSDGLDEIAGITVRVDGAKAKQVTLSQSIIGRHLPANIVIAGEYNGAWYALPSTMSGTTHPEPVLIAVDNATTPTTAYTSTDNAYALYGQTNAMMNAGVGGYVKLAMKGLSDAPLFGDATGNTQIGKSGTAIITNDLSKGWWWKLKQTNTSIGNAEDAKYTIYCQNNSSSLSIKENPTQWGLYASGTEELRLLTLEVVTPITASVTEWGKNSAIFDVNPKVGDNLANKVVAYLGEATSGVKDVKETKTSGGNASKYNYTVNFGSDIDFSAAASEGATLRLVWKKDETEIGSSVIVIPKVFATDANLHDIDGYKTHWEKKEVHVLPGNTLTIDAGNFENKGVTVGHLEIYPGATVKVTKGSAADGTLTATNLVLRYGWTRAGEKAYDVARLYVTPSTATLKATNVYADWYIDYDQYYPIGVPWNVTVSSISYHNTSASPSVGPSGQIRLRYYDGANRATGQSSVGQNWKEYGAAGNTAVPAVLTPSTGYAMTAKRPSGKAFSVVRMPLSLPSGTWAEGSWTTNGEQGAVSSTHKDQVSVYAYSGAETPWYAMGWNFIANPYMCTFNGDDDGIEGGIVDQEGKGTKYVTIPTEDFANYYQTDITEADLKPASGFFVQAASNTTITFNKTNIEPSSVHARYIKAEETMPEQQANIRLSYEGGKDQMGLLIADNYTADYEINADLAKILGDGNFVRTYMNYGGMDMAYLAINPMLAQEWIPVTVNVPVDGEYTFSLTNSSVVEALEGIYLVDYAEDNKVVNLIDDNYTFYATAGTFTDRFSINAIVGERETPTGVDAVNGGVIESDKPIKFLFHEKVYILYHGVIYDATGKRVYEINK